nr:hypothetical protein CTI12_AA298070 [Tanacetum cinerariifolium]
MPWIGIYIASASLVCILAMAADLLHGLRNRKLWFPCNYFTLNAASLSVVAVAIKLPMDINNSMPGDVDQTAKLGSMAFMCTMMANLLPSLATMDNKELLANIIALVVLYIGYYWVMAETESPQFMTACSATTSASGVICALSTILHILNLGTYKGANSMYSITQTILLFYQDTSTAELRQEVLFARLSSMISGILAACLTNLPQVIAMKCHTSFIEKREASVYATAQLLSETTQIINNLQDRELPSLNPDELSFINKWCDYFRDQFP